MKGQIRKSAHRLNDGAVGVNRSAPAANSFPAAFLLDWTMNYSDNPSCESKPGRTEFCVCRIRRKQTQIPVRLRNHEVSYRFVVSSGSRRRLMLGGLCGQVPGQCLKLFRCSQRGFGPVDGREHFERETLCSTDRVEACLRPRGWDLEHLPCGRWPAKKRVFREHRRRGIRMRRWPHRFLRFCPVVGR